MTDANTDDVILNFIQNGATKSADIRTFSIFCRDFNSTHPDHAAPVRELQARIRKALRNMPHEKYDDTTLAKMMFCLAQPLASVNLRKVKERLDKSGILRLDKHSIITYYKNDEVELQGTHQRRYKRERAKDERNRRESFANLEIKFERRMEEEARELGEREKAREEARAEEERIKMDLYNASPEDWVFDDPNVPSTSDQGRRPRFVEDPAEEEEVRAPVAKRLKIEVPEMVAQEDVQPALPESTHQLADDDLNTPFISVHGRQNLVEDQANEDQEVDAPVAKRLDASRTVAEGTLSEPSRPQIHEADSTAPFLPINSSPAPDTLFSVPNEKWEFDNPTIPFTSYHGRPGLFEVQSNEEEEVRDPIAERSRFQVSDGNWSILPEPSRPQSHESNSTVLSITSSPAPTVLRNQEAVYYYYELMQSIHNCTYVLEDPTLEPLRADVVEELVKPESIPKMISEKIISEAVDEGIKIAVKSAKSDNIKQSMGLVGFMRLLKLQLLNIGFQKDNESVSKITEIIHGSSQGMMIPMAKVRFAMETIFEKIRQ